MQAPSIIFIGPCVFMNCWGGRKLAPVAEKIGLKPEENREFKKAEEQMYLPYDEETGHQSPG